MADQKRYWVGDVPPQCQWCEGPLNGIFIDGATRMGWAILCTQCHAEHGFGIGIGRGQRYFHVTDSDRWLKDNGDRPERPEDLQTKLFS